MSYRKQAPKLNDGEHPDWFWSMSGGIDSTAAFILTKDALQQNYSKNPVAIYFDTGIGVPLNLLYLQELCDRHGVQLWTLRTNESYEEWVQRDGHPGPGAHGNVRNELKGRQADKINTLADYPMHVMGLLAEESPDRAKMDKMEEKDRHVEVRPVHRLTKKQCAQTIIDDPDTPINPLWVKRHFTDCGCGANGDPSELRSLEEEFPWFAQRIKEIEESANHNDVTDTWGWGGLSAKGQQTLAATNDDGQMTLCGPGCSRQVDQDVVDMFIDDLDGDATDPAVKDMMESELRADGSGTGGNEEP